MVSMIFHPEISSLESQVAHLQAQIAAAQARIAALGEAEATAAGALQAVQEAVNKIAGLAPSAIATLKESVLNLFNINCGGQFEKPATDGAAPEPVLNGQTCEIDPDIYWETAAPDGSHWNWASPLCCLVEDAPLMGQYHELMCAVKSNVEPVYENSSELKPAISEPDSIKLVAISTEVPNLFELVKVSDFVSYMRRTDTSEIACVYVGFSNKLLAKRWGEWLALNHSLASKFEVRPSKRLIDHKHELKLWSMSLKSIEKLAECDLSKAPPSNHPPAPKRQPGKAPTQIEVDNFQPGDVVRSVTVRNWSYTVLAVKADGFLEVERIGVIPQIRATLSPASVELVRRGGVVEIASQELGYNEPGQSGQALYNTGTVETQESTHIVLGHFVRSFRRGEHLEQQATDALACLYPPAPKPVTIDIDDVPKGITLTRKSDDLLTAFDVWITCEVRVMGRPEQQQRQVGKLTESSEGIIATRPRSSAGKAFSRTLDAVSFLISGSGLKPLPQVLVGAGATLEDVEF